MKKTIEEKCDNVVRMFPKPVLHCMQYWTAQDLCRYRAMLQLSKPEWKMILNALRFIRYDAKQPVTLKQIQLQGKIANYIAQRT